MAGLTDRRRYANSTPEASLLVGINAAITTFTVSSDVGWPPVPFTATIDFEGPAEEVVLVTDMSGATVTECTRGYDGSAAQAHETGAKFVHTAIAKDYDEANDHSSSTAAHGTVGDVVGTTDEQTLTAKTIQSSTLEATAADPAVRALAAAAGAAPLILALDETGLVTLFLVSQHGGVQVLPDDPAVKALLLKGAAAQTANMLEVQSDTAVQLLVVTQAGRVVHKPDDLTSAGWKVVPPNDAAATYLQIRDEDDAVDTFLLTTWGEISKAAKIHLTGLFAEDPIRYPLDGSLFKVDEDGNLTLAGNIVAGGTVTSDNPTGRVAFASDSTAMPATAGEAKDTGVGDVTFTVIAGHRYRVHYVARAEAVSATATCDFRIRDGVGSSPDTTSTGLAGASSGTMLAVGSDARQLEVDEIISGLAAGAHTIAAFYASAAGGTVRAGQATFQSRQLTVHDEGI